MGPTMILNDVSWPDEKVIKPFTVFNNTNDVKDPTGMIRDELNTFCSEMLSIDELKVFRNHYCVIKSLMRSLMFEALFYKHQNNHTRDTIQLSYRQSEELNLVLTMAISQLNIVNKIHIHVSNLLHLRSTLAVDFWSLVLFSKLIYPMYLEICNNYNQQTNQQVDSGYYKQLLLPSISSIFTLGCSTITNRTIINSKYKASVSDIDTVQIYNYLLDHLLCVGLPSLRMNNRYYEDVHNVDEIVDMLNMQA